MERIKARLGFLYSLRGRLVLLVLLSMLPVLILLLASTAWQAQRSQEQGRQTALRLAKLLASRQDQAGLEDIIQVAGRMKTPTQAEISVAVVDRQGAVLLHYPEGTDWTARSIAGHEVFSFMQKGRIEGTLEARCLESARRCLFAFARQEPAGTFDYILVQIPTQAAFAETYQLLAFQILALVLVTLLALAAAWFGGDSFLLRRIHAIRQTTQEIASGNRAARTGIPHEPDELGQLASDFDGMAGALEQREQQLQSARAAQMTSEERLARLLSNLPGMVYRLREGSNLHMAGGWTMDFASEGALTLTGYAPDALIHEAQQSYAQLIHPDDRACSWENMLSGLEEGRPVQITYRIRCADGQEKWVWEQRQLILEGTDQAAVIEGFVTDITESREAEQKIADQVKRLAALRAIDLAIIGLMDLKPILATLVEQVIAQLDVDAAAILLYNESSHTFEYAYGMGFRSPAVLRLNARLGEGFIGCAALQRKLFFCPDLSQQLNGTDQLAVPTLSGEGFAAQGAIALIARSEIKGALVFFNRKPLQVDEDWLGFVEALADQAAIAIENTTLYEKSRRANFELTLAYEETIEGWAQALELRDQETEGHSRRVLDLTVAVAREMGVPEEELVQIRRGALLHDIGKMGIPDHILLKPGPLTEEERAIMREHPAHAYKLLSAIPFLVPALDIPFCHHERWDGSGYPRGLKGRAIPLAARIFAVVDVWDALRSHRPYRPALPDEEVRRYILDQSGKEFDPQVVEKFIGVEAKMPWLFRR